MKDKKLSAKLDRVLLFERCLFKVKAFHKNLRGNQGRLVAIPQHVVRTIKWTGLQNFDMKLSDGTAFVIDQMDTSYFWSRSSYHTFRSYGKGIFDISVVWVVDGYDAEGKPILVNAEDAPLEANWTFHYRRTSNVNLAPHEPLGSGGHAARHASGDPYANENPNQPLMVISNDPQPHGYTPAQHAQPHGSAQAQPAQPHGSAPDEHDFFGENEDFDMRIDNNQSGSASAAHGQRGVSTHMNLGVRQRNNQVGDTGERPAKAPRVGEMSTSQLTELVLNMQQQITQQNEAITKLVQQQQLQLQNAQPQAQLATNAGLIAATVQAAMGAMGIMQQQPPLSNPIGSQQNPSLRLPTNQPGSSANETSGNNARDETESVDENAEPSTKKM